MKKNHTSMLTESYAKALRLLVAVCLFVGVTAAQAQSSAKRISYQSKDKPLSEVLKALERMQDYYKIQFSYEDVGRQKVKANVSNKTLPEAVKHVLVGTNLKSETRDKSIIILKENGGKGGWISGRVTDREGNPLMGASVWLKSVKRGVATGADGSYTINVKPGDEIVYSYIGMESKEIIYRGGARYDIELSEASDNMINEVVVTGYQDIKKEKMTGSAVTIKADKLEERYSTNILDNLEGRVAGLSTYGGDLKIRGTSSLYASTSPLLVVDGLPIEGKIEDLNPYNIESINVLKDAAATAIYGARASNGIIVITTKNAKKNGKIEVDFSANLTIKEKKNVDYSDNFYMNAEQQVNMESDYWNYYYFDNDGEIADPLATTASEISNGASYISPIHYAYYQKALGNITDAELNSTLEHYKKNNFAKEYADAIYRQQVLQQYNLSLRSRGEKYRSNLTLNYKYDNAGQINTFDNAFNINYKGSYDIAKWLTATVSVNGVYNKSREPGYDYNASYSNIWSMPAYESLKNTDGSSRKLYYWYNGNEYWDGASMEGIEDLGVNPVDEFYNNTQDTKNQHIRWHGDLQFKIIDGLTLNTQFIYENDHTTTKWYANSASHVARVIKNAYATLGSDGKVTYQTPETGGMLRTTNTDGEYWTARTQANFNKNFGKHAISAIAGLEFRDTKYNGTKSLALGYDEQLQNSSTHTVDFGTLSQIQYSDYYMSTGYGFPSNQFAFSPYLEDGMGVVVEQHHRYASGYFNLTYTFDDRYNVFGSFRKDYADVYGLNAKFRGKPLWSVGAGWNAHNEKFMKDIEWLNFLKLRVSYGVTGNIYQEATSYMTATSTGVNSYTNLPYGEVESPANPNLKWEQSRTTNIGVDFAFLDNRISGSLDYYNKEGKDIFSNRTLDPTTGFTSMFVNMASMRNRGLELALTGEIFRPKTRKHFGWTASYTFSHNSNKVTSVENPATSAYQLISTPYMTGYPTSALWSYRFAGISDQKGEKGQQLFYVEDGGTSHDASGKSVSILEYSGQSEPKVIMGLDNRFTWNGFSLSFMMSYYGGHKMRALTHEETFGCSEGGPVASYFLDAWTPENPTNTPGIGRYGSTSIGSEPGYSNLSVYDADFLKIRNIVLGYDIPQEWLRKIGVNRVSLRFQIDNPKYLWVKNDVGVDPETLGIRSQSSYIFGLNVNL